jgi:hypothetical protein
MNKNLTLFIAVVFSSFSLIAQDTIFFENFENDTIDYLFEDIPSGTANDPIGYNYDEDQLPDGSPSNRPGVWFRAFGFADVDSTNIVFASNSWTNNGTEPVKNWFILPALQITDGPSAMLSWKSAPFQTPYYCDGYKVLVSTTTNDVSAFTDTLFVAAEYLSGPSTNGGNYALYNFSAGFIHGEDGTYTDSNPDGDNDPSTDSPGDTARMTGVLRPFSVSLSNYDNQLIYVAFMHNSIDDNLLSIDDVLVTETTDIFFSLNNSDDIQVSVYPNPAQSHINIVMNTNEMVVAELMDQAGKVVLVQNITENGMLNVETLSNGMYVLKLNSSTHSMTKKVVISH